MPKEPQRVEDEKPGSSSKTEHAHSLPPKVTDKYVFFFGWEGPHPEVCLQQWYPCQFNDPEASGGYDDDQENGPEQKPLEFHSTEQYMMYWKALLMGDDEVALKIADSTIPAEAQALGRQVKNFDKKVWDENCDAVVERGNLLKFTQNEKLKKILLETQDRTLVEASPVDRIWGIGFDAEQALRNEKDWGENKLGQALMRVRTTLQGSKAG